MLINHLWGIFAHPDKEMLEVRNGRVAHPGLYIFYLCILAAIPPVAGYIGATQVGWRIGNSMPSRLTTESTIPLCVIAYFSILAAIIGTGIAINWMRTTYTNLDSKDLNGISLATFVSVPLLLFSVVGVYPVIWLGLLTLIAAASYSVYLLYTVVPIAFQISKERSMLFSSAILTIALVITVVLIIATIIIWSMGFNPVYTN